MLPSSPHLPYSVSLAPEDAHAAAASGASLLLLDVPPGTIVGIDHRSFITGPNFKGIKMIPVVSAGQGSQGGGGAHFVATNASGRGGGNKKEAPPSASVGPTNFFFFHASEPGLVLVRRWSPEHEVLLPLDDEDEVQRFTAGVKRFDFDTNLAPYDLASHELWQSLTRFISPRTTARIAPASSKIVSMSVVAEAEEVERTKAAAAGGKASRFPTAAERKLDEQLESGRRAAANAGAEPSSSSSVLAPDVVPDVVGAPRYAQLPRHAIIVAPGGSEKGGRSGVGEMQKDGAPSSPSSSSAAEAGATAAIAQSLLVTAANLDKTSTLRAVIRSAPFGGDAREFLGEFQHAFVSFWAGHSLLAFRAWKACLRLVLSCEAGPCLPSQLSRSSEGEGAKGPTKMEVDGAFFREFVDALSAQLEVSTTTTTTTATNTAGGSSSSSATTNSIVDDLMEDSFLKKAARRFLENVREASEEGGVEYFDVDDDSDGNFKTICLPPPSPELLASCVRLSRVFEERLGWAGLGKPRLEELRLGEIGGGGGSGGGRQGGDDSSDEDDSDGPVVVLDVEKGY